MHIYTPPAFVDHKLITTSIPRNLSHWTTTKCYYNFVPFEHWKFTFFFSLKQWSCTVLTHHESCGIQITKATAYSLGDNWMINAFELKFGSVKQGDIILVRNCYQQQVTDRTGPGSVQWRRYVQILNHQPLSISYGSIDTMLSAFWPNNFRCFFITWNDQSSRSLWMGRTCD